jgi:hypothetical protein
LRTAFPKTVYLRDGTVKKLTAVQPRQATGKSVVTAAWEKAIEVIRTDKPIPVDVAQNCNIILGEVNTWRLSLASEARI